MPAAIPCAQLSPLCSSKTSSHLHTLLRASLARLSLPRTPPAPIVPTPPLPGLDSSIDIVGVGGVATGDDAFQLILCGAAAVQTATTHWLEGPACFDRIAAELEAIMRKKGYSSLEAFRGKLKPYDKTNKPKEVAAAATSTGGPGLGLAYWLLMALMPILGILVERFVLASTR